MEIGKKGLDRAVAHWLLMEGTKAGLWDEGERKQRKETEN